MNKKDFIKSQKDCASMLGLDLNQYKKSLLNIKCSAFENNNTSTSKKQKDDDILKKLGLNKKDLKKRVN